MGRIVVVHPDLGVGGAERLIVDASKALQDCGHQVRIYTGYHDKGRCFQETRDGTLQVFTIGQWMPRTFLGKCHALMAYLKMVLIAIYLCIYSKHDLILCDQVSACIPIFRFDFRNKSRVIFYCHFPDQLLTQRDTLLKSLYRLPIDRFEEWSTSLADTIIVNSQFTSSVVKKTFVSLRPRELKVLYPCVNVNNFTTHKSRLDLSSDLIRQCDRLSRDNFIFLSINRFERKKELHIALEALAELMILKEDRAIIGQTPPSLGVHLIIAGGYDERLRDSVQYYCELRDLTAKLNLTQSVTFIESPSDTEKIQLLIASSAILYTPKNEHFGIVPLEAMAMSRPVVASASGGPLETVECNTTGLLCEHTKTSFAHAMLRLYLNPSEGARMGKNGLERVKKHFSYEAFRDNLNELCR